MKDRKELGRKTIMDSGNTADGVLYGHIFVNYHKRHDIVIIAFGLLYIERIQVLDNDLDQRPCRSKIIKDLHWPSISYRPHIGEV